MNDTKSTDTGKLIEYFEEETQFDVLKARKAYFRNWDHQLMQEAYPFSVKAKGKVKGQVGLPRVGGCGAGRQRAARLDCAHQRAESLRVYLNATAQRMPLLEQVVNGLVLGGYYLLDRAWAVADL